jgi:hypothetical protein
MFVPLNLLRPHLIIYMSKVVFETVSYFRLSQDSDEHISLLWYGTNWGQKSFIADCSFNQGPML